jgi:hypothetical protein
MITKKWTLELLEGMPERFSVDDFIEKMMLTRKLEISLQQLEDGKFLTAGELDKETERWFIEDGLK